MYENNNYQPNPGYQPPYQQYNLSDREVDAYVDEAFSKGLASTIMSCFPVASIIAISFGSTAQTMVERAKRLAAQRGVRPSGKNIAANILGKIGKIAGIVMTIFWGIYLFLLFMIVLMGSL